MQKKEISNLEHHLRILIKFLHGVILLLILGACAEQSSTPDTSFNAESPVAKDEVRKPNLLIIMADDLGYSDVGAYGGEIETPNIDSLALSGTQMTNFYTSLTCSPSRAMLMSGADNHLVGLGNMDETLADNQLGVNGYEGYLNQRVLSLAEALKLGGYRTYMAGKWHLGMSKELGPAARGFDDSFALLMGGASHYDNSFGPDMHRPKALYRDNGELFNRAPDGFFSSDYYTTRIINSIENGAAEQEPFFAYLSFTAPHWPLQFPPSYDGKYAQTYKMGWQPVREQRLAKLKSLGLISEDSEMAPFTENWDELSQEEQLLSAKKMEIYAAMIDDMDANIGRLITYLKSKGLYENTVVVFLSDNGAASWGNDAAPPAVRNWANKFNNDYNNAGQPDSFILYGKHWAQVSSTPYKHYKGNASEGGIRGPMILRMPAYLQNKIPSGRSSALTGIEDIMPTFLELAQINAQELEVKESQVSMTGNSMLLNTAGTVGAASEEFEGIRVIGREIWGKQGLRSENWKLVNQPPPTGSGEWQLYNLKDDLAEQHDLASSNPQKLVEMLNLWQNYVELNNVVLPAGEFRVRDSGPMPVE